VSELEAARPGSAAALVAVVQRWTSGRRALVSAAVILLLLTVAFFNPIFRANATFSDVAGHETSIWPWAASPVPGFSDVAPQSDQADSIYPWTVFGEHAFRSGTIPLWNPYSLGGTPYLTNGLGMALYPPRVLMQLLVSPSWVHDLIMLLGVFGSGIAMFSLLWVLRTGFCGSLLAAVAWMFASFNFAWIQLEIVGPFATFLPLGLLCAYLTRERRSWWWACAGGVSLGLAAVGASLQLAGPLIFVVAVLAACLAVGELRARWPDRSGVLGAVGRPLLMGAVAGGISAPVTLPSLILSRQIARQAVPLSFLRGQSVSWWTFLKTFIAPSLPATEATLNRQAVFVGGAVAVLAVFAFVALPLRRPGAMFGRLLLVSTLLVCGGTVLVTVPYHLVPGFSFLTQLGRMLDFWCFAVALLGGLGLDQALQLVRRRSSRLGPARARAAGVALAGVAALVIVFTAYQTMSYARSVNPPFQPRTSAALYPKTPAIKAILHDAATRPATAPQRILPLRVSNPTMYASHAMTFGIESAAGYESLAVLRTIDFWRVIEGEKPKDVSASPLSTAFIANYFTASVRYDLLRRAGVTTLYAPPNLGADPSWLKRPGAPLTLSKVYAGPDGLVFNLKQPAPRAFVVHRAAVVDSQAEALARYASPSFPYRSRVVLERSDGSPAARLGSGAPTVASAEHQGLNGSTWRVTSKTPGYLVVLDSWAPGWSATVNGHSARVLHANYAFRAIEVPAGSSTVRLVYRPVGFVVGMWLAGLTLVGLVVAAAVVVIRRRRIGPTGD
jgi:hypothetical protein